MKFNVFYWINIEWMIQGYFYGRFNVIIFPNLSKNAFDKMLIFSYDISRDSISKKFNSVLFHSLVEIHL